MDIRARGCHKDICIGGAALVNHTVCLNPDRHLTLGIDARDSLARQDSGGFFTSLDDAIVTGPTRTNVNDFRAILVAPGGAFPT